MDTSPLFRAILRAPAACRTLTPPLRPQTRHFALLAPTQTHARYLSVPRVLQPSFWGSMIPKPLRSQPSTDDPTSTPSPSSSSSKSKSREWNPATPFVILGLLVGSQAIQILWLKQERAHSTRRVETKIGVLREVIERVQRGEEVDVEKLLGTGDEVREREWAEVIREVQNEELLFQDKKKKKALREATREQEAARGSEAGEKENTLDEGRVKVEKIGSARFY